MSFHVGQKIIYGRAVINIDQITNESLISDQGVIIPIDSPNIVPTNFITERHFDDFIHQHVEEGESSE